MGWFQHGSTIVVFAPGGFSQSDNVREGTGSAWVSHCCGCHKPTPRR